MTEGIFNVTFAFYWMFVMLLRSLLFLLILLFHCVVFSQAQQSAQITAGEIFFNFVDEHTEDVEDTMGSTWFDDIFKHTESWTANDANELLDSLKVEFPIPRILIILRNTESLQTNREQLNGSQPQTCSDVFIDYVRNYFKEKLQQIYPHLEGDALEEAIEKEMLKEMASRRNTPLWEERIRDQARSWQTIDAIFFLNDLENKWNMDADVIVKRLNSTSFFHTTYTSFTSRLEVYVEYFGESYVKEILNRSFNPFMKGEPDNIRGMLDFIFTYFDFEEDIMIEVLSKHLRYSSLNSFIRRVEWLEGFLGREDRNRGKSEVRRIVRKKRSLNIINSVNIKLNRKTDEYKNETAFRVSFLKRRGNYSQEEIIELFKSNPLAFSMGDLSTTKLAYLERLLEISGKDGKTELDLVIQNGGFAGIVNFKVSKNAGGKYENAHVEFLRDRGLSPEQIADLFKNNPQAFSVGDLSVIKIAYLEELLGVDGRNGKAELDWMIQNKNLAGIMTFKVSKNAEGKYENTCVEFLRDRGLSPEQIADLFKNNPQAFSVGGLSAIKIAYLEELLGVDGRDGTSELNWVIQNGSFEGIMTFKVSKNAEGKYENAHVQFLKDRGLALEQIADSFKSDSRSFSAGDLSSAKFSYLEQLLGIDDRDGTSELNWVIQSRGFAGIVSFKVFKNAEGKYENAYIEFLRGRGLSPEQIADLFKSSPLAFSIGDLSSAKFSYLERFLGINGRDGKTELDWVIQNRGFAGVVSFRVSKNAEGEYENTYIEFLRNRGFNMEQIADLFKNNPQAFSGGDMSTTKITYLEVLLGVDGRDGKTELDWVIQNGSFAGILSFKVSKNAGDKYENAYVEFLRNRGISPEQIADLFKINSQAFSGGDMSTAKVTYLEELLGVDGRDGKTELDWVIQNGGFAGIINFKIYKNTEGKYENAYIKFLRDRGFNPKQIADLFKNNPNAFLGDDMSVAKVTYLEKLLGVDGRDGKTELDWVIQNGGFAGIINFKIYKNTEGKYENAYVKFLRDRELAPERIADIFKNNPSSFSVGNVSADKVAYLEKYLGKGDRNKGKKKLDQIILIKGGFKALALFEYRNNGQANRVIDFLENGMYFTQDQVIKVMEDHFSELFVEDLTEETSEDYLRRLMKKVPDICQESLSQ